MKLIAIDLDGTLLADDGTISMENVRSIREVQDKGHVVSIATGRSLQDTKEILRRSNLDCPIIVGNGARSFHHGIDLHQLYLKTDVAKELISFLRDLEVYFEMYTNDGILLEKHMETILRKELPNVSKDIPVSLDQLIAIQRGQHGLQIVDDYETVCSSYEGVYKVFVLSLLSKKRDQLKNWIDSRKDISITSSGREKLEIAHHRASKGYALELLAKHFNIPMKNTVAIGDNFNDLSMFRVAGISISMGNAEDEVKQETTYTTKNYDQHGVAYALRTYVLDDAVVKK
ncbi:Cof-type HAD-IIB family hydrolase [Virgibacillus proomii]|uniref:Cof-type HAD-IIB family hydrolase n=1 Tax=Virgibacillus proomii TaxID=84407 RepID=UPI0009854551|nr:Cof-type HAD-IIB family hydrolase [Virgibacillus proomii]